MQRERTHRLSDVREESASICHGPVIDAFDFPSSHSLLQSSISELSLFSSMHRQDKFPRSSSMTDPQNSFVRSSLTSVAYGSTDLRKRHRSNVQFSVEGFVDR